MDNSNTSKIEELLYAVDFSHGREQGVWEIIILHIGSGGELSFGALEDVAGGTSCGSDLDKGSENLWRK